MHGKRSKWFYFLSGRGLHYRLKVPAKTAVTDTYPKSPNIGPFYDVAPQWSI